MIEMKDFMATIQKQIDSCCMEQSSGKIQNMTIQMGFDIYDQQKCKEWIRQAIEIESYTPEQIEDLKIRHLFDKKDVEIKSLKQENAVLKKALELAVALLREDWGTTEIIKKFEDIKEYTSLLKGIDTAVNYFIQRAKES